MTYNSDSIFTENIVSGNIVTYPGSTLTPIQWARNKITEKVSTKDSISLAYKESLRFLISKLGGIVYLSSENDLISVKCIHANPERAVAKLKEHNNLILPIISIDQSTSDNDDERRRAFGQIVSQSFWSEKKQRAVRVISEAPRPVNINYGINIWAKYKGNLDQILEQIRLLFNPHLIVKTKYTNSSQAYITQESDTSTFNVADKEDRIVRRTIQVTLEGYIPSPKFIVTSTGEIEELNTDIDIH